MNFQRKIPEVPPIPCSPVGKGVNITQLLFSFKGRINRKTFWIFFLLYYGFFVFLYYLADIGFLGSIINLNRVTDYPVFGMLMVIFVCFFAYIQIPVIVKRLHDTNRSGFNVLWYVIPVTIGQFYASNPGLDLDSVGRLIRLAGILYLLIFCGIAKGNLEQNKYGTPPN